MEHRHDDLEHVAGLLFAARDHTENDRVVRHIDNAIDSLVSDTQAPDSDDPGLGDPPAEARTQALLRATEKLADTGGWEWDARTDEVRWTPGTKRIFGVDQDATIDLETVLDHIHPDDRERLEQVIERCLETGEGYDIDLRIHTADNRRRWARAVGEAVDTDGELTGLRGAIQDVSALHEREQRLMVLNRILRHNLRNELNVIMGRAQILSENLRELEIPAALREMGEVGAFLTELERVAGDADSLEDEIRNVQEGVELLMSFPLEDAQTSAEVIIQRSREINRLGEKARHIDAILEDLTRGVRSPTPVRPVLERVRDEYRAGFPEATIDVTCDEHATVAGIESPFERVVRELVENAIVHNEDDDARVDIAVTELADGRVEIRVADDGPGIPSMEREAVTREAETQLSHGTGIGLWLVSWVVRRLGGTLEFSGRDPQGTVARIELPGSAAGTVES